MPPVLANRDDFTFSASMTSLGSKATLVGSVLFSDLSMANYSVAWDTSQGRAAPPHASVAILNRPASLAAAVLTAAYETHSESIAQFAEQAVHSGRPVARGECWDLADSALKTLDQYDVPKVVPSLSRCHGHLIFEGKAGAQGQEGLWRGGDTEIRRGKFGSFPRTFSLCLCAAVLTLCSNSRRYCRVAEGDHRRSRHALVRLVYTWEP